MSFRSVLMKAPPAAALFSLPRCASLGCLRSRNSAWDRWWVRHAGIQFEHDWYCSAECLESAVAMRLDKLQGTQKRSEKTHLRMPLGLVLLSRGLISQEQLRQALQAQKRNGDGKVGEWLVRLGAVSEKQVTLALAVQQQAPVFSGVPEGSLAGNFLFPGELMHRYRCVPILNSPPKATLYVGFLDSVDRAFLCSLESVMGCNTQPSMLPTRLFRDLLEQRSSMTHDVIRFSHQQASDEVAHTISAYARRTAAQQCRLDRCGSLLWTRLSAGGEPHLDLLFQMSPDAS